MNKTFEDYYKKLNKYQKQAVDLIDGPVMVIAGPGTGKTQILTLRIANILLKTDTNPQNLLALTFTDSGVREMRDRLVSIIGVLGYRINISTFHGFCNDIIQEYNDYFPNLENAKSINELQQIEIIQNILKQNSFDSSFINVERGLLTAIKELKKEGVSPDDFAKAIEKQFIDFENTPDLYNEKGKYKGKMKGKYITLKNKITKNKEFIIVYQQYQDKLKSEKFYDFEDMVFYVLDCISKNEELRLILQEKYQYLLVDEHQDTNTSQNKIVNFLVEFYAPNSNIFVVGDEKQAVYRFQGASLENFLYFKKIYPQAQLITLKSNYRSSQIILDGATDLILNNSKTNLLFKELLNIDVKNDDLYSPNLYGESYYDNLPINIVQCIDDNSEYLYIANTIKQQIQSGVKPRQIAIIFRNNKDAFPFVETLARLQISYSLEISQNILKDIIIQKFILLIRTVQNIGNDDLLIKTLHIDFFKINPLDIYRIIEYAKKIKKTLWDCLIDKSYEKEIEIIEKNQIEKCVLFLFDSNQMANNEPFDRFFINLFYKSGLSEYINTHENYIEMINKINTLYENLKIQIYNNNLYNIETFIKDIELYEKYDIAINKGSITAYKDGVRIMTAHKSKGLEFDIVYIPNVYDGHWGNKRKRGQFVSLPWSYLTIQNDTALDDENEDERRLFYVAMTRAKKQIFMTYSQTNSNGKNNILSQFVQEISDKNKVFIDITTENNIFQKVEENFTYSYPKKSSSLKDIIENKNYFLHLFRTKGLSVSGLNNYLSCPNKYFLRNLIGIPDAKNEQLIFGSAIHHAIDTYIKNRFSYDFVFDTFVKYLKSQTLTSQEYERLVRRGNLALESFYNKKMTLWDDRREGEFTIKGIRFDEDIFLNGKIDMIVQNDDKSTAVYDFKTGKPKSEGFIIGSNKSSNGDYKRQLVFYKILFDRYKNGEIKVSSGVISFVEQNEHGEHKDYEFEINDEEVKELESLIRQSADEIVNLSFLGKYCGDDNCQYCKIIKMISGLG